MPIKSFGVFVAYPRRRVLRSFASREVGHKEGDDVCAVFLNEVVDGSRSFGADQRPPRVECGNAEILKGFDVNGRVISAKFNLDLWINTF